MTTVPTQPTRPTGDCDQAQADKRSLRRYSLLLLIGAVLIPVAGQFHPTSDPDLGWNQGVAAMLEDDAWYPAHILEFLALGMVAVALWQISRTQVVRDAKALRLAVIAVAVGTTIHVIDLVPHTFAATEATALLAGDSTPLWSTHLGLQALATLVLGPSVAVLAVTDARRSARWTWLPALLGVVGGLVGALAGPALLITEDTAYAALFIGYAGLGLWLLITAIRRLVALRGTRPVALT
ncbi:MAG: hypothetical protein AAGD35_18850 [Actinomycetota bacterium]